MKKEYIVPMITVKFFSKDIITASGGEDEYGMFDKNIFGDINTKINGDLC